MSDDREAEEDAEFTYEAADGGEDASSTAADEPFADVDGTRTADTESAPRDDSDEAFAELFEETAIEALDSDRVWAQLQAEDNGPSVDVQDREIREFDKRSYCHQCPHFSEPPAVRCGHEGTTILELVDVRTFRVANCPVVIEEESLEDG